MSYYHHKIVFGNFNTVIKKVIALLKKENYLLLQVEELASTLKISQKKLIRNI